MKIVGKITKWLVIAVYAVCAALIVLFLVPIGGWKALDVLTGSMKPAIQPGDLAIIHRVPLRDIQPGNIVTYTNPNNPKQTITHRVVSKPVKDGLQMVVTKGDANAVSDQPFAGGHIVGREVVRIPLVGRLLELLHKPVGLLLVVILPGLFIIWSEIMILRRALSKPEREQAKAPSDHSDPEPPTVPPARNKRTDMRGPTIRLMGVGTRLTGTVMLLTAAILGVGVTYARTTTNRVQARSKLIVTSSTALHPTSIFDCIFDGYKKFGFKNVGQCVVYVIQHQPHPPLPTPTFPPIPTPKPPKLPVIPTPVIPSPPIIHHDATPSPSPSASPSVSPSPSTSPKH